MPLKSESSSTLPIEEKTAMSEQLDPDIAYADHVVRLLDSIIASKKEARCMAARLDTFIWKCTGIKDFFGLPHPHGLDLFIDAGVQITLVLSLCLIPVSLLYGLIWGFG
jgi:hypothetical protein